MRITVLITFIVAIGFFSCQQNNNSTQDVVNPHTVDLATEHIKKEQQLNFDDKKYIDTRYEYSDSKNKLIVENSLPRGGLKYTDPNNKDYIYAIFWTRITNESNDPVEFTINFPADSFKIVSSPNNSFKLLVPQVPMTIEKQSSYNYGLTNLEQLLDAGIHNPSSLKQTIKPKGNHSFYVIGLFNRGLEGTVRAGLSIRDQQLFYRVNDEEIQCGRIIF